MGWEGNTKTYTGQRYRRVFAGEQALQRGNSQVARGSAVFEVESGWDSPVIGSLRVGKAALFSMLSRGGIFHWSLLIFHFVIGSQWIGIAREAAASVKPGVKRSEPQDQRPNNHKESAKRPAAVGTACTEISRDSLVFGIESGRDFPLVIGHFSFAIRSYFHHDPIQ
jgi:hypothetical protein